MTAPSESHDAVRVAFVCEVMKSIPLMSLPSLPVSFNFAPLIQATASANTMCAFAMPHVMPPARAWVGVEHRLPVQYDRAARQPNLSLANSRAWFAR